jgi:hypothetical protein
VPAGGHEKTIKAHVRQLEAHERAERKRLTTLLKVDEQL